MLPKLQYSKNGTAQLLVDGKPFPILGGELCNSSSSDAAYMEKNVWPHLRGMNMNTVVLPVAWETIEPEEDTFDFSLLKIILEQARRENLRIVLLWFGLWKNGESYYVPQWVKRDTKRFFRVRFPEGTVSHTVSPFCMDAVEADRKAFCRLMSFLREEDETHTVIMVQIENEMGILGADRDYSEAANAEFAKQIPDEIAAFYGSTGNWKQAFGEDAEEIFMVWRYARDTQIIASAGRQEKDLPMYVNAWLAQHPNRSGLYPSGGPVAKWIGLWRAMAPALDMVCPDIYEQTFAQVCRDYALPGNALFIPEAARHARSASKALYAFGAHHAVGFSPFGIELVQQEADNPISDETMAALNIMADAMNAASTVKYLPVSYRILRGMYPKLDETAMGFLQEHPYDRGTMIDLEHITLRLDYTHGETGSGGILLPTENGFYIAGCNTRFTIQPRKGRHDTFEILRYEDGEFIGGQWHRTRVRNGDELWDTQLGVTPEVRYIALHTIGTE